jgi:hypothetical protein
MSRRNNYAAVLGDLYERTPKEVLAAIAVSLLYARGNDDGDFSDIPHRLRHEWHVLHDNEIVLHRPPRETAPWCPKGCGPLHNADDAWICPVCEDEWAPEAIES